AVALAVVEVKVVLGGLVGLDPPVGIRVLLGPGKADLLAVPDPLEPGALHIGQVLDDPEQAGPPPHHGPPQLLGVKALQLPQQGRPLEVDEAGQRVALVAGRGRLGAVVFGHGPPVRSNWSRQPTEQKYHVTPFRTAVGAPATATVMPQPGSTASAGASAAPAGARPEGSGAWLWRQSTSSARMATAISSWVEGPRSRPAGLRTRARSSAATPW